MNPPCDSNDYDCAYDGCANNGHPLVGNKSETVHETDTGGHKKEAEIMHKEARQFVNPFQFHNAQFERGAQEDHTDNTGRNRDAGESDQQLAGHKKCKQNTEL